MRERIQLAAAEQDLDKLRSAIERNEVMPLFGEPGNRPRRFSDAIQFLTHHYHGPNGSELFALLRTILNAPNAIEKRQPVDIYVWPAHAVDPALASRTPTPELYRFVSFSDLAKRTAQGTPLMHRIEIGADGTWHLFATR